ncbi:MAG TPA: PAS domain S-box protein [Pyrinomonadaceae bacterium]|nr:PAS domain S-box protein [Pyrinomonadaceae bacterium]
MKSEETIIELFGKMPYKPLVEEIKDYAIFHLNIEGQILSWNQGAERIFGYSKNEVIERDFTVLFTPEDRAQSIPELELKKAEETGRAEDTRWHLRKDDSRFFAQGVTTALRNEGGKLIGFAKIARDGTAQREMEEALLESEEKYRIVAETATDAIISINEQSTILFVNRAATRIFGYEIELMIGQPLTMLMPEYLRHIHRAGQERYLKTGKKHVNWEHVEVPALHRDGHEFPLELSFGEFSKNNKHIFIGIARDITERKRAEEIIRQTKARLESVLKAGLAGTFFWDIPNDRVLADENMARYFSLSEKAVTEGVTLEEVLPAIYEEDRARVADALTEAIEQTSVYQIEYRVNHSDGKVRWLSARGSVERDKAGNALELTGFAVDITRIKEAEEQREQLLLREQAARQEAEQANRLKDEFLATLSHELRTPLNAILGWSQILQNNNLDETAANRAMATIERNARAQSQLIDDILDVSRIITGKLRLDVRAVDLSNVISAAVDAARPAAEAKNIRLQILIDPQGTQISGDPDRLQQVVWNLLSNAVKFTPKDGRVQVRLERVNSNVEIVVSDTGIGVEPEFLPFVFERFRQSDGSMTRRQGGLGLGLAIVRQIVELHGGTVSVKSKGEGQGSTFIVSLPLVPVRLEPEEDSPRVHPAARNGSITSCPPELSGLRVLLVDDEADSLELLKFVVESCEAQVSTASSAAGALELIRREKFDVLISDIGMPDEDGYSLIRSIRALSNEQGGNIPAIALTAYARAEDRVRALLSGFQMHIAKPVEALELIAAVANLAGRMRNPHQNENENE